MLVLEIAAGILLAYLALPLLMILASFVLGCVLIIFDLLLEFCRDIVQAVREFFKFLGRINARRN